MTDRRMNVEISLEAPYEETGMFSENPSAGSSTEPYGLKVVSYMKMRGKEPTGEVRVYQAFCSISLQS